MKNLTWIAPLFALALSATGCTEGAGTTGDGCPPKAPCGDGMVDRMVGEVCDPGNAATGALMNLGNDSCTTLGMSGEGLLCDCRCQFDLGGCANGSQSGMGGNMSGM